MILTHSLGCNAVGQDVDVSLLVMMIMMAMIDRLGRGPLVTDLTLPAPLSESDIFSFKKLIPGIPTMNGPMRMKF